MKVLPKKNILGVDITNAMTFDILEYVSTFLESDGKKLFIVTPNPEILVYANSHHTFRNILNQAQISLCDGVGLLLASRFLGKPLQTRVTGIDFMERLVKSVSIKPITVGFLGGKGKVAEMTAECLKTRYPGLNVVLAEAGNPDEKTVKEIKELRLKSKDSKPIDVLFVGYGFPRQEEWVATYLEQLPARVVMVVGGAFDIISSSLPRAPKAIQSIGFEWLWRLILEPWRLKRQLALPKFVYLVLKERFQPQI